VRVDLAAGAGLLILGNEQLDSLLLGARIAQLGGGSAPARGAPCREDGSAGEDEDREGDEPARPVAPGAPRCHGGEHIALIIRLAVHARGLAACAGVDHGAPPGRSVSPTQLPKRVTRLPSRRLTLYRTFSATSVAVSATRSAVRVSSAVKCTFTERFDSEISSSVMFEPCSARKSEILSSSSRMG